MSFKNILWHWIPKFRWKLHPFINCLKTGIFNGYQIFVTREILTFHGCLVYNK